MSSPPTKSDQDMRQEAFAYVREQVAKSKYGVLTKEQLSWKTGGFDFKGKRFSLIHPQWGGYKPRQMSHLLSLLSTRAGRIKYGTPVPKPPAQEEIDSIDYLLINRQSPDYFRNRYMRDAWAHRVPILFFLETEPQSLSRSSCFVPTLAHIQSWEPEKRRVKVVFSSLDTSVENLDVAANTLNHRYVLAKRKQRLHQDEFRNNLKKAYQGRCAISGLSESDLLDAAHIIPDHQGGQPEVSNGLLLSKIHHAAFDAHLIGITPDYRVQVSKRLREQDARRSDLLALLKKIDDKLIRRPRRKEDYPSRDCLAQRYEEFQAKDKS